MEPDHLVQKDEEVAQDSMRAEGDMVKNDTLSQSGGVAPATQSLKNRTEADAVNEGGAEVPAKKLGKPKKRACITDNSDMDDSVVMKPGHAAGDNEEGDGNGEGLSKAELR